MRIFLISSWLIASIFFAGAYTYVWAAESDVDKLLDLLVQEKVITQEKATAFRANLAVKKQEEKETQKEFIVTAAKPIKISGYTQVRYRQDNSINDTFDIRRARLDIKGDITERFDYRAQFELAGSSPFLLDATIGYKAHPYLKLTAGQFKIPFSQENLTSSPKLETINRSQVVEALVARSSDVIGNQNGRDIGVQASGSLLPKNDYSQIDYALAIVNGSGINRIDYNKHKDFVGRLVYHPLKEWSLGTSYYNGYDSWGSPIRKKKRNRIGVEFAYVKDLISLRGEYIQGVDDTIKKNGWYLQAGYFLIPKTLQGVFKFDTFDPNNDIDQNEANVYTFGANWYFNKWAFLQLNYELKDEMNKEKNNNALTGQLTLQF